VRLAPGMTPALLWLNESGYTPRPAARRIGERLEIHALRSDRQPTKISSRAPRSCSPGTHRRNAGEDAQAALDPGDHLRRRTLVARPDLRADVALSCARGTHACRCPKHPRRAVPPDQALRAGDPGPARAGWVRRISQALQGRRWAYSDWGKSAANSRRRRAHWKLRVIGTRREAGAGCRRLQAIFRREATDEVLSKSTSCCYCCRSRRRPKAS